MRKILLANLIIFLYQNSTAQGVNNISRLKEKLTTANDSIKLKIYTELGLIYDAQDRFDSAVIFINKAYSTAEKMGNEGAMADAMNNLGTAYYNYSQFEKAMDYYLKALKIYEAKKLDNTAIGTLTNIANIYAEQNKYDEALGMLTRAVELNKKVNDTILYIYLYANLAQINAGKNNIEKIYEYARMGLDLSDQQLSKPHLSSIDSVKILNAKPYLQMYLGIAFMRKKKFNESNSIYKTLLDEARLKMGVKDQVEIIEHLSDNYNQLKKFDSSLFYSNLGFTLLKNDSIPESYRDLYEQQATAFAGLGKYDAAYNSQKNFKEISDSILNKEGINEIAEMQTKYETEKKDQAILQLSKEKKSQRTIIGLSIGAVVIALGLFAFALRSRNLQKKLFRQKEQLLVREKEIELNTLQQKMTELEQMALRAQMNPHFIFNSLNSVQHYVMKQDVEGVNRYLGAFAHLVRQTLNNSGKQFVTLDEEVKYLDTYLSLEKMKSNNRFNYAIKVGEDVDRSVTYIPGMILQPFVENSIKHGVAYKKENDGQITIRVSKNGKLVCIIEDNGIGRQKAREIKLSGGDMEYESKGMAITMNRIETINKLYNAGISVQIDDAKDNEGKPAGTRVKVEFASDMG